MEPKDNQQGITERKGRIDNNDPYLRMRDVLGVDIRTQSARNLADLERELGPLSPDESKFLDYFGKIRFALYHETTRPEKVLDAHEIRSYDALSETGELDRQASFTLEEDKNR